VWRTTLVGEARAVGDPGVEADAVEDLLEDGRGGCEPIFELVEVEREQSRSVRKLAERTATRPSIDSSMTLSTRRQCTGDRR